MSMRSLEGNDVRVLLAGEVLPVNGTLIHIGEDGIMLEIGSMLPTQRVFYPMLRVLSVEDCGRRPR